MFCTVECSGGFAPTATLPLDRLGFPWTFLLCGIIVNKSNAIILYFSSYTGYKVHPGLTLKLLLLLLSR